MYICMCMHLGIYKSKTGAVSLHIYLHTGIYVHICIAHIIDLDYLLYIRYVFFR